MGDGGKVAESKGGDVTAGQDTLTVDLDDGRTMSMPLACYPRLLQRTTEERAN